MNKTIKIAVFFIAICVNTTVQAGSARITDAGVKNIGSSVAFIAHCEMESLIPVGNLGNIMATLQKHMAAESWYKIKNQYQKSLYVKKQYSVVKKRWIPFRVDKGNCRSLEKAIPIMFSIIRSFDYEKSNE